jgi:hypothetical protein
VGPTVVAELHSLVETAADEASPTGAIERIAEGGTVELRCDGRPFARLGPDGASFRLGRRVAAAAARTPGAAPTADGPDWVDFRPAELDRFAVDRATSWTEFALRQASEEG